MDHGTPTLSHGDYTGARVRALTETKVDYERAVAQTLALIRSGDDIELITIPGGRTFAVPREVVTYLRGEL